MIYFINFLVLVLTLLLTNTVLPVFSVWGAVPLLPLYYVIALSMSRKGFEPFFAASFAGLYLDIFSPYPLGFYFGLFILATMVVRFIFSEEFSSLGFPYFVSISGIFYSLFLIAQLGYIYLSGGIISWTVIAPSLASLGVNIFFIFLLYFALARYFEELERLRHYLKKR